jgi:hypothetical protein
MSKAEKKPTICQACGCALPRRRKYTTGRATLYCSPACKQAAFRNRKPKIHAGLGGPSARYETDESNAGKLLVFKPRKRGRASSVTLLGDGQRTSWDGYALDRETVEKILQAEVGSRVEFQADGTLPRTPKDC